MFELRPESAVDRSTRTAATLPRSRSPAEKLQILAGVLIVLAGCVTGSVGTAATAHAAPASMTLAVIGDYGCLAATCVENTTQQEPQVAALVHSWSPDSILTVGDNSYDNGTTAEIKADQQPYAADIGAGRFYSVVGIHDWGQQCSDPTYIQRSTSYFGRPAHYVAHIGSGLLDYFATDMNCAQPDGYTAGSAQANQYLADVSASTSTWRITAGHAPFYSSGYFSSQQYTHWAILPQIDLFLSGHDHDMEHLVEDGQNYAVVGTSGEDFKPLGSLVPGSVWSDGSRFGALRLTVTQTTLTADFVSVTNVVLHSFTITKGASTAGTVSGNVVDPGGAPIPGATVAYKWGRATTDAAGGYKLNNMPAGTYPVTAAARGYVPKTQTVQVTVGGGTYLAFQLVRAPTLSMSGQVTDAVSGSPLSGASIAYSGGGTTSDSGGRYTFSNVSAGSYQLAVGASGYQSQSRTATVGPGYVQGALANAGSGSGSGATSVIAAINPVQPGDRVVVGVRVDSSPSGAVVKAVSDSAGNVYTKHVTATNSRSSYQAEVSIWSTVVTAASTSMLTLTANSTGSADISIGVAEYSGLSTLSGAGAIDQTAAAGGVSASGPSSGPTSPTTANNELAVGIYGDAGSNVAIAVGADWSQRFNNSANSQGTIALEDQPVATQGMSPNSQWSNASPNSWAVAEAVFKSAPTSIQNFALNPPPAITPLSLSGQVTDGSTGQALSAAAVSYSGGSTTTDSGGNYSFGNINAGSYQLTASASGYQSEARTATIGPGYLQEGLASAGSGAGSGATTVSVALPNPVAANNRVVVGVRVDSNPNGAVVQAVSDSAGNIYTKHVTAVNNRPSGYQAEVTIWSAVITAGVGTRLTLTATSTGSADLSIGAAEYSGLSNLSGAGAVDQVGAGGAVATNGPASGPTPATTNTNELAVGYYGDGGSNVAITAGSGWSQRFNNSANNQGTIALEDQVVVNSGSNPNSQWSNASPNSWAVAEAVFKSASTSIQNFALNPPPPPPVVTPLSISGQVIDGATGKSVSGAAISYGGGSTTSDTAGNYSFSNVNAGSYSLAVSASGYQSQSRSVTVGPGYVQGGLAGVGSGGGSGATSLSVGLPNPVAANNRLVVGVRVDSNPNGAVVQAVSDSAGNVYTKHVTAINNRPSGFQAEVTIWSALVTAGAGSRLTVTATSTGSADLSIGVAEYSGLSALSGAAAVDQVAAGGALATSGPASGPTPATTNSNELAVGYYGDGGSNVAITPGTGWSQRFNNSANSQGTIALEDQVVVNTAGTPNSQWSNSSPNSWAVAEAVFKSASTSTQNFALNGVPNVTGTVKSAAGQPLLGATVSFSGGTSTTDSGGNFALSAGPGTYALTTAAAGYANQTLTITVVSGAATNQNFSLNPLAAYVQGGLASAGSGGGSGATTVSVGLPNPVAASNRVVVGVRVDSNPNGSVVQAVSDSAGNVYTKHVTAINNRPSGFQAEVTIWSAVVIAGAGTRLTVTATSSGSADLSIGAAEYSGLSTLSGPGAVDQVAAGGAVGASGPASGATPATTNTNELAVGYYGDGGSNVAITPGTGWSQRFNNSANSQGTIALEDQLAANPGATPNSQWSNASPNSWAVAEAVFKAR
jgi:Carboxypeptidase regulatory-like domain/Calcineurin-like phosphoesterase